MTKKISITACQECGGKGVTGRFVKGLCSTCYARFKFRTGKRKCDKCGITMNFPNKLGLCKPCKVSLVKEPHQVMRRDLTPLQLVELPTLFRRFKTGRWCDLDLWRVANVYMDIYETWGFEKVDGYLFEKLEERVQVVNMLKVLKEIWDRVD
jgi:hypothetical protein